MAIVFNANTYQGEAASGYVSRALMGSKSLAENLVTVLPNIKKRQVLRTLEQDIAFQNPTPTFNASGNLTFDERVLTPVEMSVMLELNYADLLLGWEAASLRAGHANDIVPGDLAQYLINYMQRRISAGIEKLIWQGKQGSEFAFTAGFSGLLSLLNSAANTRKLAASVGQLTITGISIANPGVVTVASTADLRTGDRVTILNANAATLVGGVAISGNTFNITVLSATTFSLNVATTGTATATGAYAQVINAQNVVDVLTAIYNAVPDSIKSAPDFTLYVPMHVADAYRIKQASVAGNGGSYFATDKALNFLGRRMEEMPYFNFNTVLASRSSNLYFGTDLLADFNEVQVVDMRNTTADQKIRYRSTFSADVNYGFDTEVVLYRPA
jgi:hypothetical protein